MVNLLKGALICSPFIHFLFIGKSILTSQALLSILLELAVICLFFVSIRKREPNLKAPVLFFAYITANSFYLIGKGLLLERGFNALIFPLLHIVIFMLFYFALCNLIDKEDYGKIAKVIVYPAVILSIYTVFQYFDIDMFNFPKDWIDGVLGNPTNNAMYLTACLPFSFMHKRPLIPAIAILTAIMIFGSASALIGALAIIAVYLAMNKRYGCLISASLSLIVLSIVFYDKVKVFLYSYEKLQAWQAALTSWQKNYWWGHGVDTFKNIKLIINSSQWYFTHNHYIWILHSLGLAGLIFFANWIRSLNFVFNPKDIRCLATLSLISVGIMACVSVPMRVYPLALVAALNLAIITKEKVI